MTENKIHAAPVHTQFPKHYILVIVVLCLHLHSKILDDLEGLFQPEQFSGSMIL